MENEDKVTLKQKMQANQLYDLLMDNVKQEFAKPMNQRNLPQLIEYLEQIRFCVAINKAYIKQENEFYEAIRTPLDTYFLDNFSGAKH